MIGGWTTITARSDAAAVAPLAEIARSTGKAGEPTAATRGVVLVLIRDAGRSVSATATSLAEIATRSADAVLANVPIATTGTVHRRIRWMAADAVVAEILGAGIAVVTHRLNRALSGGATDGLFPRIARLHAADSRFGLGAGTRACATLLSAITLIRVEALV